jgi:hypothetical protein
VARLVRGVDAQWEDESAARFDGATLHAGESIGLLKGLAQIDLDSGSRIVVQSPCRLRLVNQQTVFVEAGKITVHAGQGIEKFQVPASKHSPFFRATCVVRSRVCSVIA